MDEWMGGWVAVKAVQWIAYSNQKLFFFSNHESDFLAGAQKCLMMNLARIFSSSILQCPCHKISG
jgi:hypothetical protein